MAFVSCESVGQALILWAANAAPADLDNLCSTLDCGAGELTDVLAAIASDPAGVRNVLGLGTAALEDAGVANGVAELDASGHVPASQLPDFGAMAYVDNPTYNVLPAQSTGYVFGPGDEYGIIPYNSANSGIFRVPLDSTWNAPLGTRIMLQQVGVGAVNLRMEAGATLYPQDLWTFGPQTYIKAVKVAPDTWVAGLDTYSLPMLFGSDPGGLSPSIGGNRAIVIGSGAYMRRNGVAVGVDSYAQSYATAIGDTAKASHTASTAIGVGAQTTDDLQMMLGGSQLKEVTTPGALRPGATTVATLPLSPSDGARLYCTDARCAGEAAGAGTGCEVVAKGGQWYVDVYNGVIAAS